jgi:hypothetical protein
VPTPSEPLFDNVALEFPPNTLIVACAESYATPNCVRRDMPVDINEVHVVPSYANVSEVLPPTITKRCSPASQVMSAPASGGGECVGVTSLQVEPFHSQVSPRMVPAT